MALLRAIGMRRGQPGQMIAAESVIIAVIGAVPGSALGLALGTAAGDELRSRLARF
jgi:ABC-type antimicrobial peptide transport system permease subunit